jgi:Leucine-rich repeat (LRR) protein
MKNKKETEDKIQSLLLSGTKANVELAVQLAKSQQISLEEYLKIADLSRAKGETESELLIDFFTKRLLSLERKGLKELPDWIFKMPKVSSYYLGGNDLKSLPDYIPEIELEDFCVEGNQLQALPDSFANLKVEYLDLSSNDFERFPEVILGLRALKILEFGSNKLDELPPGIQYLESLEELYLDRNVLKGLPEELSNLKKLKKLDLSANQLDHYPTALSKLMFQSLKILNLSKNKLSDFPSYIRTMASQMELVVFRDNPISDEAKAALEEEPFFQLGSIGWDYLDERDFYEEL